jgi:hypothetical protein
MDNPNRNNEPADQHDFDGTLVEKRPSADQDMIGAPEYMRSPGQRETVNQTPEDEREPKGDPEDYATIEKEKSSGDRTDTMGESIAKQDYH